MKKGTIYIHIGIYKTGTTAIQSAVRKNYNLKKEKISEIGRPTYAEEICTTDNINDKFISQSKQEIFRRIRRERFFGRDTFIISVEQFSGNPNNGFKNSAVVAKTLKKITEDLKMDIKIICYLRRQDTFIQSLYTQEIHQGGSLNFKEYIYQFDEDAFDWNRLLDDYADNFGKENIIVRRYGKRYMADQNSIVRNFGEIIGSETLMNYTKTTLKNRGYSRDALEIARRCNPHLDHHEKKELRRLLQSISTKNPFENYHYFDLEKRKSFLRKYEESNKQVAKNYFDEEQLFEEPDVTDMGSEYEGLSNDTILMHLIRMIKEINSIQSSEKGSRIKVKRLLNDKILTAYPTLKEYIKVFMGRYY